MGTISYTQGNVTIKLTGDLAERMRERVKAAGVGIEHAIEAAFDVVAAAAEAEWYGPRGVKSRTGMSGDIDVVSTVNASAGTVNVSIGSRGTKVVQLTGAGGSKRTGNRPYAVFVRSASAVALVLQAVDHETYWRTLKNLRGPYHRPEGWVDEPGVPPQKFPAVYVSPDNAGTGHGYLLEKLVKAPTRKAIKAILPKLAKAATGGK